MRCDQFMGLPKVAIDFLREHEATCPCCKQSLPDKRPIGYYTGMFEDKYLLVRYTLTDSRTADEFLQAEHLSSGPMFFIGLRVSDGQEFTWTQEEIDNATW